MVELMLRLDGKNRIREFCFIANAISSRIIALGGVAGVVFLGGLVRGFADKFSDVDIIVLLNEKDEHLRKRIQKIGSQEQERSRVDIDLEVHFLEDFERWRWDETDKWDFSHADIVFDPRGEVHKLFCTKMKVSEGFWVRRIAVCAEYLKWYCCPPRKDVGTIVEAWVERGDMVSAHYGLNYSIDLLINIIFALNKEFLPAPKWKVSYSHMLKWLPADYESFLKETITVKTLSIQDLDRRLKRIRKIWSEVVPKIEDETGLTPNLISKYYCEKVLHQKQST